MKKIDHRSTRSRYGRLIGFITTALIVFASGCDATGPGIQQENQDGVADGSSADWGDGVVLSKRFENDLADFIGEVQFGVVLPMTARLNRMEPDARSNFMKRLRGAENQVTNIARRIERSSEDPSASDIEKLEKAAQHVGSILENVISRVELQSISAKTQQLVARHPFLAELTRDQIRELLWRTGGSRSQAPNEEFGLTKTAIDTSDGDTCTIECTWTFVMDFVETEIIATGAVLGCSATSIGFVGCALTALGYKFYQLARQVYSYYTCTNKCHTD